jgi:ribosomal protein S16
MNQLGLADKGEAGRIQMLQSGISGMVQQLKSGMPMGSVSDRDLQFIESLGPSLYEDQATRSGVLNFLRQKQAAKIRFNVEVNKEMTKPGANMSDAIDKAQQTMETKYPIVPVVPADLYAHWADPSPQWSQARAQWAAENKIRHGTIYRKPNGALEQAP